MGDNFSVQVNASIQAPATWYNRGYPRVDRSTGSLIQLRRGNDGNNIMKTEISMLENGVQSAAAVSFQIFDIDREARRYDQVEVYGECAIVDSNGVLQTYRINPKLSYVANRNNAYLINGNKAEGFRTSSYRNTRSRLNVEFEYPVQKIVVEQKIKNGVRGWQRIGIGPMIFSMPEPLPAPNDDGLIFSKRAIPFATGADYDPSNPTLCYDVRYKFEVHNVNSVIMPVSFRDELNEGMYWRQIISMDEAAVDENTVFNEYNGTRNLQIDNLIVPCGGSVSFEVEAAFDLVNALPGTYTNIATIDYTNMDGLFRSLDSNSTSLEIAAADGPIPTPATVDRFDASSSCYKEGSSVITVTMQLNINAPLNAAEFDISFSPEFVYVDNSLNSATISGLSLATIPVDEEGIIFVEGLTIPAGLHTITFQVRTPATEADLVQDVDQFGVPIINTNGKPVYVPFNVGFSVDADGGICDRAAIANLFGDTEIPYCSSKTHIISNKNVTVPLRK